MLLVRRVSCLQPRYGREAVKTQALKPSALGRLLGDRPETARERRLDSAPGLSVPPAGSGRRGATVVTSMHQLVAGLAALHPCWTLSGDRRQDRDRHRSSVGSQLRALDAAGVLRWQVGVDAGQEQHHTELVLLLVPELLPGELAAAAVQLARWEARCGRGAEHRCADGHRGRRAPRAAVGVVIRSSVLNGRKPSENCLIPYSRLAALFELRSEQASLALREFLRSA